jgi:hypothetical protein
MAKFNCYGQPGTRGPRKAAFTELTRPAAPVDLAGHLALQAYLWKVAIAPDADAATRNAAAAEHRAVTKTVRSLRGD